MTSTSTLFRNIVVPNEPSHYYTCADLTRRAHCYACPLCVHILTLMSIFTIYKEISLSCTHLPVPLNRFLSIFLFLTLMSRHHFTRKLFHMHNCMPVPIPYQKRDEECIPITLHYLYSTLTSLLRLRPTIYITHPFSFLSWKTLSHQLYFSPLSLHAKFITRRSDKTWCYQHYYYREEEWWSLKSDTRQFRPVRDNKSIKTIKTQEHHDNETTLTIRGVCLDLLQHLQTS